MKFPWEPVTSIEIGHEIPAATPFRQIYPAPVGTINEESGDPKKLITQWMS